MRKISVVLVILLLFALGSEGQIEVGERPKALAIADFNRDGLQDIVVANSGTDNISVLLKGDGIFQRKEYEVGLLPSAVASGDIDKDGCLDVVVVNSGSDDISVLLGKCNGTFTEKFVKPWLKERIKVGENPRAVVVGHFDDDGKLDLSVALQDEDKVLILRGDGKGRFSTHVKLNVGRHPRALVGGDFDRNGCLDIAAVNFGADDVHIFLGQKEDGRCRAKEFQRVEVKVGEGPSSIDSLDLNGDAILDLAVTSARSNELHILLGKGDGTFELKAGYAISKYPIAVAIGGGLSFEKDHIPDLVIAGELSNDVYALLGEDEDEDGRGDGTFQIKQKIEIGEAPSAVAVGYLDIDACLDIAVAAELEDAIYILAGGCDGTFEMTHIFVAGGIPKVGKKPLGIAIGDFDRDRKQDIATANSSENNITVLLGKDNLHQPRTIELKLKDEICLLPSAILKGDLDRDGIDDLTVACKGTDEVWTLMGDDKANFEIDKKYLSGGALPSAIAMDDLNKDGWLDLAVVNAGADNVCVLLGSKLKFKKPQCYTTGSRPGAVLTADLDRDGCLDLAVVNQDSDDVSILLGGCDGTFTEKERVKVGERPTAIAVGDFDENGISDLAVANRNSNDLSILLGRGDGTFDHKLILAGDEPLAVVVGDFYEDGKDDLAVVNFGFDDLYILKGDGKAGFELQERVKVGEHPLVAALANLAIGVVDGELDLVVACEDGGVYLLLGRGDGTFKALR